MSFHSILSEIVGACPGALGLALMGSDGIPIDQVAGTAAGDSVADDVGVLGVEFGRILEEVRKAADSVGGGGPEELSVRLGHFQVVLRAVDDDTYLVMALAPAGNAGKARFLLRRHLGALREQL